MIETKSAQKKLLYKANTFIKKTSYGSFVRVSNKEYKIKETIVPYELLAKVISYLQEPKKIQLIYEKVEQSHFSQQDVHRAVTLLLKMNVITLTNCNYIDYNIFMYVVKNYRDHDDVLERFLQSKIQMISGSLLSPQKELAKAKLDFFYESECENTGSDNYLLIANSIQDLKIQADFRFDCIIIMTTFLKTNVVTVVRNIEELAYIGDVLSDKECSEQIVGDLMFNLMINYALLLLIDFHSDYRIFGNAFFFDEDLAVYNKSILYINKQEASFSIKTDSLPVVKQKEALDQFIVKAKELYDISFFIDFKKTSEMKNRVTAKWMSGNKKVSRTVCGELLEDVVKQSLTEMIEGYFQEGTLVAFGNEQFYHQIINYCIEKGFYKVKYESLMKEDGNKKISIINNQLFKIEDASKNHVSYHFSIDTDLDEYKTEESGISKKTYDINDALKTFLADAGVFLTFWDDKGYFHKNGTFIFRVNANE